MKPYLLFIYYRYYPKGGWNDYHSQHDSIEAAKETFEAHKQQQVNSIADAYGADIVDREQLKLIIQYHDASYEEEYQGWQGVK